MTERERFEAWARQRWTHPEDFDQRIKAPSKYNNYEVQAAWDAWQERTAQNTLSAPDGWLRAIDEALVIAHLGVANESDTYEQAKTKLDSLVGWHIDIATDPAVNGGWKLAPIEPTQEMSEAGVFAGGLYYDIVEAIYEAMLAVASKDKS